MCHRSAPVFLLLLAVTETETQLQDKRDAQQDDAVSFSDGSSSLIFAISDPTTLISAWGQLTHMEGVSKIQLEMNLLAKARKSH